MIAELNPQHIASKPTTIDMVSLVPYLEHVGHPPCRGFLFGFLIVAPERVSLGVPRLEGLEGREIEGLPRP